MAAIGKIRSWGPWLVGVIALALFGFIAGDMWRSCETTGNQQRQKVGEVMGNKILYPEYMEKLEEYKNMLSIIQGDNNPGEDMMNQLRDYLWNNYVTNTLIEAEAKKLGLTVTDDELSLILKSGINPALRQVPMVQQFFDEQTGRFDYNRVALARNYYAQSMEDGERKFNSYWKLIEELLRQQVLMEKYQTLLQGCMLSNPVAAKMAFDGENNESKILLASMPYTGINDNDVAPTDAELKAKYEELKPSLKQSVETRDVKYIAVKVTPSDTDRAKMVEEMQTTAKELREDSTGVDEIMRMSQSRVAYNGLPRTRQGLERIAPQVAKLVDSMAIGQVSEPIMTQGDLYHVVKLLGRVTVPDTVEYRAIQVVATSAQDTPATIAQRADSIITALKGGMDFDTLAVKYNRQAAQTQKLTPTEYQFTDAVPADVKDLYQKLINSPAGETLNVAMTSQGFNLVVQVLSRKGSQEAFDVAVVTRELVRSKETYNLTFNQLSQFVSENQTLASIIENAPAHNYTVTDLNAMPNTVYNIAGFNGTQEAVKWVFEQKEGDVSQLYDRCSRNNSQESANEYLIVVGLDKIHPVGYRDQASVEEMLKTEVMKDKKFALLKKNFEGVTSIAAAQQKGARVDTIARATFPTPVSVLGNQEPVLSGAVAVTDKGQMGKHVVKGEQGAYLFQVLDRTVREGATFDAKAAEQKDAESLTAYNRWLNYDGRPMYIMELMENGKVVDNRYQFR